MCDICRRTYCPSACPNHRDTREAVSGDLEVCSECGAVISDGEWCYCFANGTVCTECAARIDVEDLLRLTGIDSRNELLRTVGGERRRQ
jgi:hypothetical protein